MTDDYSYVVTIRRYCMAETLNGKRIALLATNDFEDSELTRPMEAVKEAGGEVTVISLEDGTIAGENGTEIDVDLTIDEVNADEFDALFYMQLVLMES